MPTEMRELFRRRPVLVISFCIYGAYCVVALLGLFWRESLLMPAFFVWPYPFLLTIQRLVPSPSGTVEFVAALALGFVVIGAIAALFERRLGLSTRLVALAPVVAVLVVVVPLGALTLIGYTLATTLGWPLGE